MALEDYLNKNNLLYETTGQYQNTEINEATQSAIQNWFNYNPQDIPAGGSTDGGDGNKGNVWQTLGSVWEGAQPIVTDVISAFNQPTPSEQQQQEQAQQPVLTLGGQGGINTNQLITWGALAGVAYLVFQEMG